MPSFRRPFRRRPPHPALERFLRMAEHVDRAQRGLLAAIPTSRDEGVPLVRALSDFERELDAAGALMPGWRTPSTELVHDRCADAIRRARAEAPRFATGPRRASRR